MNMKYDARLALFVERENHSAVRIDNTITSTNNVSSIFFIE